jgi:hypothetical protein
MCSIAGKRFVLIHGAGDQNCPVRGKRQVEVGQDVSSTDGVVC